MFINSATLYDIIYGYRSRALAHESYAASAAVDEAPYGFSRRLSVSAGCISSECKFSRNFRVEFKTRT